jgi:hypothetical protein
MLPEGQIGVPLQVLGQPLPQCRALNGRSTGDLVDVEVPGLAPPFQPALDGGAGDPEELLDPLLGMPRSMAASALNLRSFEYAFMWHILTRVRYLRKPLLEASVSSRAVEASGYLGQLFALLFHMTHVASCVL